MELAMHALIMWNAKVESCYILREDAILGECQSVLDTNIMNEVPQNLWYGMEWGVGSNQLMQTSSQWGHLNSNYLHCSEAQETGGWKGSGSSDWSGSLGLTLRSFMDFLEKIKLFWLSGCKGGSSCSHWLGDFKLGFLDRLPLVGSCNSLWLMLGIYPLFLL